MNTKQRFVIIMFFILIGGCAILIVAGNFLGPNAGVGLVNVAMEGFKISIAALVGALSASLGGGVNEGK